MKSIKFYNMYIFLETFTRNIVDIYSVVFLYQKGFTIRDIIGIYSIVYFLGIFVSKYSIIIGNKIGYKYILFVSSILTIITFIIINQLYNPYLISLFLSLTIFTYHPIRHFYGISLLKYRKEIGNILIYTYLSSFLSSYFVIKNINIYYLIIITIISIVPSLLIKNNSENKIIIPTHLSIKKTRFYIYDQTRILFLLLEPLYLYLISDISYVGMFNIILTISSVVYLYLISNKLNLRKYYKIINIFFFLVLFLKLNIKNKGLLLVVAFLEGIGIKTNELVSNINLYDVETYNIEGYIIYSEMIFCLVRTIILSLIFITNISLKLSMYLLLTGVILLSNKYPDKKKR